MNPSQNTPGETNSKPHGKASYATPDLKYYGPLRMLTQAGGSFNGNDGAPMSIDCPLGGMHDMCN